MKTESTGSMPDIGDFLDVPAKSKGLYWPLLALATVLLITVASLIWNYEHPFGFNWDESVYLDEMQTDVGQFHAHGVSGAIKAWLVGDPLRPPAYRVFAFPFALLFGPSPFVLRFVATLFRAFTLALVYLGICRVGGRAAAALSVILLDLCPDFIFFGTVFYNEYVLYLAVAGMCCFVFRSWNQCVGSVFNCLGLGVFLGIGALAKASFPVLAGCFLGIIAFLSLCKRIAGPSPQFLLNASVVGALIAVPWWLLNFRSGLGYVRYAVNFSRGSMGPVGIGSALRYLLRFLQEGLGLPIACLCITLLIVASIRYFRARQLQVPGASSWAVISLLLAPLPTLLAPLATHNQVMYHTSQALILLAAGFALLAENEGWLSSPIALVIVTIVIVAQLALTLTPVILRQQYPGQRFAWTTLGRWEQWDWNQFRVLLRSQGLKQPTIGYIGLIGPLNPPQIQYPWISHNEMPPPVTLLWRQEDGTPEMTALVAAAGTNEVVFTVPDLATGATQEDLADNLYNTGFAERMQNNRDFGTPLHLRMGRFHPADVWIFIQKDSQDKQVLHTTTGPQLRR
ncbi:MAG TPA: glycosyltransferase family 39 protein [Verrucomicrobiae bacterium]|nr:glycosyltransferase family 39 protein [Verrucomicrobiae bacterium]